MTKNDKIRNELAKAKPNGLTMEQIRLATGLTIKQTHNAIGELKRYGYVVSSGPVRRKIYTATNKEKKIKAPQTLEERRASHNEWRRRRRREAGCLSREAYNEQRRKEAAIRRQAEEEERAAAKAERKRKQAMQMKRAQTSAKRRQTANAGLAKLVEQAELRKPRKPAQREPQKPAMTVDEWLAAGNEVIKLAPGEASKSVLRDKGHHEQNRLSWEQRQQVLRDTQ